MASLLHFEAIEACLVFEATVPKQGVRQEAQRGLHHLFLSGEEMPRGDFKAMLGMSDRGATHTMRVLAARLCGQIRAVGLVEQNLHQVVVSGRRFWRHARDVLNNSVSRVLRD